VKNMVGTASDATTTLDRIPGAAGIILAGGKSERLGMEKLSLRVGGELVIENLVDLFGRLFEKTILSVARGSRVRLAGCETVEDEFPGSLGGIYSGLRAAGTQVVFVAACDMPFINADLIRYQSKFTGDYDLVIPRTRAGLEPLHAFYSKNCLEHIEAELGEDRLAIRGFFERVRMKEISPDEIARFDPEEISFFNINTQADLRKAEEIQRCMATRS
jgi:molybdopterin-guanine dinucleotide biosynthesis protein A